MAKTKVIEIKESKLVKIIENIVNEAVKEEKTKWLNEQKKAKNLTMEDINNIVESKVRELIKKR